MDDDPAAVVDLIAGVIDCSAAEIASDPAWLPLIRSARVDFEAEVEAVLRADLEQSSDRS